MTFVYEGLKSLRAVLVFLVTLMLWPLAALATTYTTTVPGTSITLPGEYPEAGGVAFVFIGDNGNIYYQFSSPDGAFRGFQNSGNPAAFRGNPFTINDPISLNCGFSSCRDYFGGGIATMHVRFSAYDGDTQPGGFDEGDIDLLINGFSVGNWSTVQTEITNNEGTTSFGFTQGFGNNTFNTGWFESTNQTLLEDILDNNGTTQQIRDDDPNDNYWDFRRGPSLTNQDIVTVAPGYTLEKTANKTDFLVVDEEIEYEYIVTNIGSVPIRSLSVADDKISSVTCDTTTILDVNPNETPNFATCTGIYTVTQEDVDAGGVTNIAQATGTPDFGVLGNLTDTVTVNGPASNPIVRIEKSTTLTQFGPKGSAVPYSFEVFNDGNVTLTNFNVTDSLLPGLSCVIPDLAPDESATCTGSYSVKQSDLDNFATSGTELRNDVEVTADDPFGTEVDDTDFVSIPGQTPDVDLSVEKTATTATYDDDSDVIQYEILVTNTGTVTFPGPPVITDVLTGGATCPSGPVAPGASITCLANYPVDQDDIDAGQIDNNASASITIGTFTAQDDDDATVTADRTTGLTLDKRLTSASPTNFSDTGVDLFYEFELTNTGNVTLETPVVMDDLVAVTCVDPEIAPMSSIVCTSVAHTTDQDDLNEGEVVNEASAKANAKGTGDEVVSNDDTVTVSAVLDPEMTMTKTAPMVSAADFEVGDTITYTYEITNSGNIDITTGTLGADKVTITDDKIGTFDCFVTPFLRGAVQSCTADYTVKPDDVLAGTVVNKATATAGTLDSNEATETVSPDLTPAVTLSKTADVATVDATTDTITYTFNVFNSGDTEIILPDQPITINDIKLTAVDCSAQPVLPDTFAPGEDFDCTATYNPTQAELDAGEVKNTATASFDFTNNGATVTITSDPSEATVGVVEDPDFTFTKVGAPTQFTGPNQDITYTFTITNIGNVTLTSVVVTDPLIPALVCSVTDLSPVAPNNVATCTGTYTTDQDDVDDEEVVNTARAVGQTGTGGSLERTAMDTVEIDPTVPNQEISVLKVADKTDFTTVGEKITYTFEVANIGTQTVTDITVTDSLDASYSCVIPLLQVGDTNDICTYEYTVDQDDIDAGSVLNTVTAAGPDVATKTDDNTVNGPVRTSSYTFSKTADGGFTVKDDEVEFTLAVTNTGNTRLLNVQITDALLTPASCTIASIEPGATDDSCVGTYTILQADVDAGTFTNTASVTVDTPTGVTDPADQTATEVVSGPAENASLAIEKLSTDAAFGALPDSEDYTFSVTNDGNVTMSGITLNDPDLGFSCPLPELEPGDSTSLCADGITQLAATKVFDQGDIDAGNYTNTATVTGQSKVKGTSVQESDTVTVLGPTQAPSFTLDKNQKAPQSNFDTLNEVLTYTFAITNNGNVTITAAPTLVDDKIGTVTCPALPAGGLAPTQTLTCEATYQVKQDNLDDGFVTNEATATISQPIVAVNPGDPTVATISDTDTETVNADQDMELTLLKRLKAGSAASFEEVGDEVTFEYVITNTGNVTTTDDITLVDDQIPGTLTCASGPIAPMGQVICELLWVAEQSDLNSATGSITNTATASTEYQGNTVDSNDDTFTIAAVQNNELTMVKTLTSAVPDLFAVNTVLTYSFQITNTGNTTIDGPITINDSIVDAADITCPTLPGGVMEPDDVYTCSGTYDIGGGDILLGSTTNVASATGTFAGDPVTSNSDNAIYPVGASPAISLAKNSDPVDVTFSTLNDPIVYTYTVTNTGGTDLSEDIFVTDNRLVDGTGTPVPFLCRASSEGIFSIGASFDCPDQTYNVTQDDLDAGFVTNEAIANTVFAPGTANETFVVSPAATKTVTANEDPSLIVVKAVDPTDPSPAEAGDTLNYTITTTNNGNQTISGVSVDDPLIPALTCTFDGAAAPTNVVLLPGEALICTGSYEVTQEDIDGQSQTDVTDHVLNNVATVTGTDPQGVEIEEEGENDHPLDPPAPLISLAKTIIPDPGTGPAFLLEGQEITFRLTATNTGNITLNAPVITDDLTVVPQGCTLPDLEPGEDAFCDVVYTITQDDLDRDSGTNGTGQTLGGVTNTATVTTQPENPDSNPITATDDVFAQGPPQEPAFALTKDADLAEITTAGQIVTYTYVVANIGNITLFDQPEVTDDKIGTFDCGTMPATGLAPGENISCTAPYPVTQQDIDNGGVTNIATVESTEVPLPTDPGPARATETVDSNRMPDLTFDKAIVGTVEGVVDEVINYTYTVTNSGNVTLTDVTLDDQHTSASGTVTLPIAGDTQTSDAGIQNDSIDAAANGVWDSLAPGDVVQFTASYTINQEDIDTQTAIVNVATVVTDSPPGTTPPDGTDTETVTPEAADPSLVVVKTFDASALSTPPVAGETVTFTIRVTNDGNQTLTGITLDDTFEQVDGDTLSLDSGPTLQSGDAGVAGVMEVGEVWTYEATYELQQDDIDAGGVSNSVEAEGTSPNGTTVDDTSDNGVPGDGDDNPTVVGVPADPSIEGVKSITSSVTGVGELVTFRITVQNTGNVTLTGVSVVDTLTRADGTPLMLTSGPSFSGANQNSGVGILLPNETATYDATYRLVQEDIDAGGIENTATVAGTPPVGGEITDVTDSNNPADGGGEDDPTVLTIDPDPAIEMTKSLVVDAGGANSFDTLGQILTFSFVVENTGTVTLTEQVTVSDPLIEAQGNVVTCPLQTLAPGDMLTCEGEYSVTQDDLDRGEVLNSATASVPYDGTPVPTDDPSEVTVPGIQTKSLDIVKTLLSATPDVYDVNTRLDYQFVVTNDGNVTVDGPITINDSLVDSADITCAALVNNELIPDETLTCTASYSLNAANIALGSTTNVASATGTIDGVDVTSPTDSATYPVGSSPALTVAKDSVPSDLSFAMAGDLIPYTYTLTNSGNAGFSEDITITDDKFTDAAGTPEPFVCRPASEGVFNVNATYTCTSPSDYEVTQADLDAGFVTNEAVASSVFAAGTPNEFVASSDPVTKTVPADLDPELTVAKSVTNATATPFAVDDVIEYQVLVTNTGNQTISGVMADDDLLSDFACTLDGATPPANIVLAPDDVLICTGSYTVLQSDIDTGSIVNEATASGTLPNGQPIDDEDEITTDLEDGDPAMTLVKSATPTPFGDVGSDLTYIFTVTNTGNVTLRDLVVNDTMAPSFPCTIAELTPGNSDTSCSFMVEITQEDVDEGEIFNEATLDANDPNGDPLDQVEDDLTTQGPDSDPSLEVTKTRNVVAPVVGAVLEYRLEVENTGNVTLDTTPPVDTMQRANGETTQLDAPFVLVAASDTDGDGLLDVGETWVYTAEYTLSQRDLNAGGLSNTVTVEGTAPDGTVVDDTSDDGIDGDESDTEDPTVFDITQEPALDVVKTVSSFEGRTAGDQVVFQILATNTGNVDLTGLSVTDTLLRADGTAVTVQPTAQIVDVPATLSPNEVAEWSLTYVLEQADIDAGGITNTATATGQDPEGEDVSDVSNNGDPSDGNQVDDETEFEIVPTPGIEVLKTLASIGAVAGEDAVFTITVENTGNVTLTGVSLVENMTNFDGDSVTPVLEFDEADGTPPSVEGTLQVGETATYTATYELTQADIDSGGIQNIATATGTTPGGVNLSDQSDDDGTNPSDPTRADITATPSFDVVKTVTQPRILFPTIEEVTFTITVTNTGNVTQNGIQVEDDLTAYVVPGELLTDAYPPTVTAVGFTNGAANGGFDGEADIETLTGNATLAPDESATITVTSTYSTVTGRPAGLNVASVTSDQLPTPTTGEAPLDSNDADGDGVPDGYESDTEDRDGDGIPDSQDYDPTGYFYCEEDGTILSGGLISVSGNGFTQTGVGTSGPINVIADGSNGFFQFHSTAPGTFTLAITYPPSGAPSTTRLSSGTLVASSLLPANPASLGSNEAGSTGALADFSAATNTPFYTSFVIAAGDPFIINNNIPLRNCAGAPTIFASKTADRANAVFGETVNFTLSFRNDSSRTYTNVDVVDLLPAGLLYTPGSSRVNNVATEPTINGRRLSWTLASFAPGTTTTVTLATRVAANGNYGTLLNRAFIEGPNGVALSNVATAEVRIEPEHVFDCSDVIGKVFDDRNRNGYQDGPYTLPTGVTDQGLFDSKLGKFTAAPTLENREEPGLAGVRLVTPNGTIITTDEFGRYNVPCAALPRNIGTNFVLKLDTRTLPSGYRVTTENPRVERLTAGKFAKMNFGAALSNVVDIDLTAAAFQNDTSAPNRALGGAVNGVLQQIKSKPSTVRLSYILQAGEDKALARARLRAVENVIRGQWRGMGNYKLIIEKTVKRVQ
ncbi:DUF7507 domain-containing protein [Algirhabdus cladophorae]|uniref:DUF7507 domain-containing protein n=1 Tax=Algirhabdus cladophorae TaxID=3377108 RepID=UPI003B845DB9